MKIMKQNALTESIDLPKFIKFTQAVNNKIFEQMEEVLETHFLAPEYDS